jgi:phosphinothricin acetyltransferase
VKTKSSIRVACEQDARGILNIYEPYILNTAVTFEEVVPELEAFKSRLTAILHESPFLVCEVNGQLAGYAYASSYRSRAAYRWNREVSVYVHEGFQRRNIARAMYHALFGILRIQGFTKLFGIITLPNQASVALHEELGFKKKTVYTKVGFKLGQWHDVGWWELDLCESSMEAPGEIKLFSAIKSRVEVDECLKNAETFLHI